MGSGLEPLLREILCKALPRTLQTAKRREGNSRDSRLSLFARVFFAFACCRLGPDSTSAWCPALSFSSNGCRCCGVADHGLFLFDSSRHYPKQGYSIGVDVAIVVGMGLLVGATEAWPFGPYAFVGECRFF